MGGGNAYVLDAVSGKVCNEVNFVVDWKFISDEECIFLTSVLRHGDCLELVNVRSGDLLSVMDVEWEDLCMNFCLATCPRRGLIAICPCQHFDLKIIKLKHPGEKTLSRETRR